MNRRVFAATMLLATSTSYAHAVLREVTPKARASVTGPVVPIRLRFNSRIDAPRSVLTLVLPDGSVRTLPAVEQPAPDTLSVKVDDLKPGRYTLRWQVLAADGHITRGEVPFQVR